MAQEFLDAIIAVKAVDDLDEAINIALRLAAYRRHRHRGPRGCRQFVARVDSAIVLHNASTQFADGGEFGMGVEIALRGASMRVGRGRRAAHNLQICRARPGPDPALVALSKRYVAGHGPWPI
jgi:gamma-glutamyl phosphate reductase